MTLEAPAVFSSPVLFDLFGVWRQEKDEDSLPLLAVWFLMRCTLLLSIAFPSRQTTTTTTTTTKWKMIFDIKNRIIKISVSSDKSSKKWPPMKLAVNCKKKKKLVFYFIEKIFLINLRVRNNKKKMEILSTGMSAIFMEKRRKTWCRAPASPLCSYLQPLFLI